MPTPQTTSSTEEIHFSTDRKSNPKWPSMATILPTISQTYGLRAECPHFDGDFATIITGPTGNLRNFLTDSRLKDAKWRLNKSFKRPFSSAEARYWLMPVSMTFEDYSSYRQEELYLISRCGIRLTEGENFKSELTGSLWRFIFLLKDRTFSHDPRFTLSDSHLILTGLQVIDELRRRYTTQGNTSDCENSVPPAKAPIPRLRRLKPRPWETVECCIPGDCPCEFCEGDC